MPINRSFYFIYYNFNIGAKLLGRENTSALLLAFRDILNYMLFLNFKKKKKNSRIGVIRILNQLTDL